MAWHGIESNVTALLRGSTLFTRGYECCSSAVVLWCTSPVARSDFDRHVPGINFDRLTVSLSLSRYTALLGDCYCTVLYYTVLYCTVLCCAVLYCTVLCCAVLYCTVLYCTVLCCTVLYRTVRPGTGSRFDPKKWQIYSAKTT